MSKNKKVTEVESLPDLTYIGNKIRIYRRFFDRNKVRGRKLEIREMKDRKGEFVAIITKKYGHKLRGYGDKDTGYSYASINEMEVENLKSVGFEEGDYKLETVASGLPGHIWFVKTEDGKKYPAFKISLMKN